MVLFPDPFQPVIAKTSPEFNLKEISLNKIVVEKYLPMPMTLRVHISNSLISLDYMWTLRHVSENFGILNYNPNQVKNRLGSIWYLVLVERNVSYFVSVHGFGA